MIEDRFDRRLALGVTGVLAQFNAADVLHAADIHVATRLCALAVESTPDVELAVALAVRAVRQGSICVDLAGVADAPLETEDELTWPEPTGWIAAVAASPVVTQGMVRLEGSLLYLDRYWREEQQVCDDLLARIDGSGPEIDEGALEAAAGRIFPLESYAEQRAAAAAATRRWTTVLTGGPGTGKTTTVAGLLAMISEQHELTHGGARPRIALCAPTGKASARLQESIRHSVAGADTFGDATDRARVDSLEAMTMHRLLGWVPNSSVRFRRHRGNRLPFDVVVVDEASMVSLTMMARLLEALRPQTRLVLVGDKDQLSSVEAGAVLADVVAGLQERADAPVVRLHHNFRFGDGTGIAEFAEALRADDVDGVLDILRGDYSGVQWIDPSDEGSMASLRDDLAERALAMTAPAESGDAEAALARLDTHRLLCAHRNGPFGVAGWNHEVERLVAERSGVHRYDEWYAGRPVLVTANDRSLKLYNGDTGVTVRLLDDDGQPVLRVAFPGATALDAVASGPRLLAPSRVPGVQTVHAMTVHKSQGSQAHTVTVVLPPEDSALLTRELFYTAVTRAEQQVRVVASEESIRAAVTRHVQRATGLTSRLTR